MLESSVVKRILQLQSYLGTAILTDPTRAKNISSSNHTVCIESGFIIFELAEDVESSFQFSKFYIFFCFIQNQ